MKNKKIDVLVRAIIEINGKILVCRKIGNKYYFFPGGHVEFGESAKKALKREIKEELGLNIKECSFIGSSEHSFVEDGKKYHEINLVFQAKIDKTKIESKEDHLQFFLLNKKQLIREVVLPEVLKEALLKWFRNKKIFFVSQLDNQ
jgi:8-oxo-dGTP pyrophosphatase MutT (NUDIX family)